MESNRAIIRFSTSNRERAMVSVPWTVSCTTDSLNGQSPSFSISLGLCPIVPFPLLPLLPRGNPCIREFILTKIPDGGSTTVYRSGDFIDLCRGPHVPYSTNIQAFSSTRSSSTNWLGKVGCCLDRHCYNGVWSFQEMIHFPPKPSFDVCVCGGGGS